MFESLRSLSDHEVLTRTHTLSVRERKITLSLLLHLNELERRKLHLEQGHATLFAYCTAGLGYSAAAAMRRIQAARCIARFPEVYALLESNQANLSTISQVAGILSGANKDAVLGRIRGKSQREVEGIVAEYAPLAAVPRDRVRTVVVRVPLEPATDSSFRNGSGSPGVTNDDKDASAEAGKPGPEAGLLSPLKAARLERRAMIQFSASESFMAKVKRVRSIASHRLPANASLEQVLDLALVLFIEREDPAERRERREKRKEAEEQHRPAGTTQPESGGHARNIPARVRDEVFVRDKRRCTYVGANSQRCGSTHVLQIDHITPVARGGAATMDNLRLLCAFHNRLEAERLMGRSGPRRPTGDRGASIPAEKRRGPSCDGPLRENSAYETG